MQTQINTLPREDLRTKLRSATCWHCDEHSATDIHHLDSNHRNNLPENLALWCKRCHNEHHGISDNLTILSLGARQLDDVQRQRIAMGNRISAYERLGYDARSLLGELFEGLIKLEKDTLKKFTKVLKLEPVYSLYLDKVAGVGPSISIALISEIGDPGRFETISALWAYSGLDVKDGKARKRRKGEKSNWNGKLRSVCAKRLTDQFIKLRGSFGRELYDRYKAFYTERDTEKLQKICDERYNGKGCKGWIDNRARRKVAKIFLACLWVAWRRIKGLDASEPYAAKLGHTHIITPEDWVGQDWLEPNMR